jgi:hypothetical protein
MEVGGHCVLTIGLRLSQVPRGVGVMKISASIQIIDDQEARAFKERISDSRALGCRVGRVSKGFRPKGWPPLIGQLRQRGPI